VLVAALAGVVPATSQALGQQGLFPGPSPVAVGTSPRCVEAGDLDGDGTLDLVVTNWTSGTVSASLGLGGGEFGPAVPHALQVNPHSVVIADFDDDGVLDLAAVNGNSDTLSVLAGLGGAVFAAPVHHAVGISPRTVRAADVNGDGALDLVVAEPGGFSCYGAGR